jgi:tetratricopeptide (TPR) repeat protein
MKIPALLVLLVLLCIIAPAGTAGIPAPETMPMAGAAPQTADSCIRNAQAAVSERNWTGVQVLTTEGLARYPENAELWCLQGYAMRKTGQYRRSVLLVSEGIRLDPRPVRYANRAYGYLALGNWSAALTDADAGIALNASYATNYGVKALALRGLGRNDEALAAADTALALEPGNAHYWHVKGIVLAAAGNCTGARQALERSLDLDPGYNLPYPDFAGAGDTIATLNTTCPQSLPAVTPVRSSPGATTAPTCMAGFFAVFGLRRLIRRTASCGITP